MDVVALGLANANAAKKYVSKQPTIPALAITPLPTFLNNRMEYNGVAFTRDNVVTLPSGVQYAAWFDTKGHPVIGKRTMPDGLWTTFDLSTVSGNPLASPVPSDGHNNICIGIDSAGFIHVSGNHHDNALRYVRSTAAGDITAWTTPAMVGTSEDSVTYPQFVNLPDGTLLFVYRNGLSGDGDVFINRYSTGPKTWARISKPLQGTGLTPAESPYVNQPCVGPDGTIGLFVVYRVSSAASGNHDLGYIKSTDGGVTWKSAAGTALTLPIHPSTTTSGATGSTLPLALTISSLINQSGAAIDTQGRPHTALWQVSATVNGAMDLHHIWWDGSAWHDDTVLIGVRNAGSTALTLVSRVAVLCTNDGRTLLIYRVSLGDPTSLWVRDVTPDASVTKLPAFKLADIDLAGYEPTFDYNAVRTLNQLHMLITPVYRSASVAVGTASTNFTSQWGAVLSADLSQLSLIAAGVVSPAGINRISASVAATSTASTTAADVPGTAMPAMAPQSLLLARITAANTAGAGRVALRQRPLTASAEVNLTDLFLSSAAASTLTTVASNGTKAASFNGSGTLNVTSTTGFPTAGVLLVTVGNVTTAQDVGTVAVTYTGKTSTTFTGCSTDLAGQTDSVIFWTDNPVVSVVAAESLWQPLRGDLGDISVGVRALARAAALAGTFTPDSVRVELATLGQPGRPALYTAPRGLLPSALGKLAAYWKVSTLGLANTAAITTVPDSSGNGGPALAQATGGLQPTYATAGINGVGAVQFAGAQILDAASAFALGTTGWTIITVASSTNAVNANAQQIIASDDSGASATRIMQLRYDVNAATVSAYGFDSPAAATIATSATLSPAASTARVVTQMRNSGLNQLWLNGVLAAQITTSGGPNGGSGVLHLGARKTANGGSTVDFLTGFVGDVLVFTEPLTHAERKAVESMLAVTYGITL